MEVVPVDLGETGADVGLRDFQVEYHEWMAEYAGEVYNPEAEFTEDIRTLKREVESWAWVARLEGVSAGCVLLYGEPDSLAGSSDCRSDQ